MQNLHLLNQIQRSNLNKKFNFKSFLVPRIFSHYNFISLYLSELRVRMYRKGKSTKQFVPRGDANPNSNVNQFEVLETSNQYSALKDDAENVESTTNSFKQMSLSNQKILPSALVSLVGKVRAVKVIDYKPHGLIIEFTNVDLDSREGSESPAVSRASNSPSSIPNLKMILSWKSFPGEVQKTKMQDRLEMIQNRLPIGTLFNIYIDSLNAMTNELQLKFATRPALIINHSVPIKRPGFSNPKDVVISQYPRDSATSL